MTGIVLGIFLLGYAAIAFENRIRLNKAASALITGVLCWTVFILYSNDSHVVNEDLVGHVGEISGILFFLLGAMTIVELIDGHDGFELITNRIQTKSKKRLLWLIAILTFFLSAILDNLTTAIVIVALLKKLIKFKEDRLLFCGMVIISANAGGAWSPIGDVTTTMLWIGGQITTLEVIKSVFIPSVVCALVPLLVLTFRLKGKVEYKLSQASTNEGKSNTRDKNIVFFAGIGILLLIPVFKTLTGLPPYMGMLLGLGIIWLITETIHSGKDTSNKDFLSVLYALRKIDSSSILFFLGILLAVGALEAIGVLKTLAVGMEKYIGNETLIVGFIGLLSSIVDNVPLVAASMAMYGLDQYHVDHFFWLFLAYCTGTGGSILIIGSAAGVAAMGIEKIEFFWYLKKISWLALIGFVSGGVAFIIQSQLVG